MNSCVPFEGFAAAARTTGKRDPSTDSPPISCAGLGAVVTGLVAPRTTKQCCLCLGDAAPYDI